MILTADTTDAGSPPDYAQGLLWELGHDQGQVSYLYGTIHSERILPHLERGGAFVAVGVLHLPGDDGILSLLEKRGIRVRALY